MMILAKPIICKKIQKSFQNLMNSYNLIELLQQNKR